MWREKHKIPFNSRTHSEQSPIDIRLEYEEDRIYSELLEELSSSKSTAGSKYVAGRGDWLRKQTDAPISKKEVEETFSRIEVGHIEENDDGTIIL